MSLMQGLGFKRSFCGRVYMGDANTAIDNFSGYITSAVYSSAGGSLSLITLTHPAISFNYIVNAIQYSVRASTQDNDANTQIRWVYQQSTTNTVICYEFASSDSSIQQIGFYITWTEV